MTFAEAWEQFHIALKAIHDISRPGDMVDEARKARLLFLIALLCITAIQDREFLNMLKSEIEKRG